MGSSRTARSNQSSERYRLRLAAAEDAVAVNAGIKLNWDSNTSVFSTFDGKFADRVQTYGGNVGFRVSW
ncbi:autotransporter outer membrane beta-barrel domain-containing protein [Mesorhizobium sp. M0293]|uniref:autotransporter outer membrane beta-barrel domain-containing protein n=1 Tax=unclassified Mesorhizobium TaxID=325217 RepID=UPI00333DACAC